MLNFLNFNCNLSFFFFSLFNKKFNTIYSNYKEVLEIYKKNKKNCYYKIS